MNVQVRHRFARVRAVVHDEPEALRDLKLPGNGAGGKHQMAENSLVVRRGFGDSRNDFLWYDQQMNRGLRLDVVQHDAVLVLVFNAGGDFAVDDFLEEGFHTGTAD